ncbi:PREDICTED: ileal sodium/bile acid cotransporter-like isoform X1 [Acromyrmex echinatior]|nr:PREDICTED: ileal sodium/bile acid cotransporter-like isoform X1 [Acromyrmex echinatior]XP_011062765.1 PREDICTED: ileal sodium/bile acid cotransporter-like isoform X1 [Acromyrmex echinatior]XP_011062774.1 PREDICTED: ileal sodium/bile acid cotransporter-like isoform X1 [Acromyrmex echinatior]XP_011062783.1 PREDICTED: ileal sodium/bile acid cotransporter-like isoform X1 [Acromyrmex echinatior]XP_011062792.1 PREDICTED: ileal sodium/bile acid cotransporter-like isoform X1 [Acromyrmex echinatior]
MAGVYVIGLLLLGGAAAWTVDIAHDITVHMNQVISVPFSVHNNNNNNNISNPHMWYFNTDQHIAKLSSQFTKSNKTSFSGIFNITGVFLGRTTLTFTITEMGIKEDQEVAVITVIREERTIDSVFTASVAILVSILYINFGCAIDWNVCRNTLRRPIGPAIGFFCQFLIMPLLSFFIGYLLFPDHPELQIGMFFTGISPSGGASNMWTLLLDGNLNLSITMTTICTIGAFGMMPFWVFTLGRYIFAQGKIAVPYQHIGTFVIGLIIPLAIGFIIQKKFPRVSKILVRVMKPFSVILIIFIIIFAIMTNLYIFKLFTWKIIIAGMGLPWLGFTFGFIIAYICKQSQADIRAIAIETGIQNTGVAIFLLRFTLKPPADDLTTVVPVSAAMMTPVPLAILFIIKLIYKYKQKKTAKGTLQSAPSFEKLQQTTNVSTQLNESKSFDRAE